jgi:dTMP kinase
MRGKFVTFEGPEGGGKSSVCKAIVEAFSGTNILVVREPGTTRVGEQIRGILQTEDMPDRAELMLFEAARACIVDNVILPTLESGNNVLCDRFYDSTMAYQGYGRGVDLQVVSDMNWVATKGLVPDLTIVFDLDPAVGMARKGKATDRIEAAGADFHARVRNGFLKIADMEPSRVKVIDASMPLDEVVKTVYNELVARFGWGLVVNVA